MNTNKNPKSVLVIYSMLTVAALALSSLVYANQSNESKPNAETKPPEKNSESKTSDAADQAQREKQFTEMLTNVVLEGSWQVAHGDGLGGKAPLSQPRTDRYTIDAVRKVADDQWIVGARVEYMEKDVTLPVPVRVIWAGDTPVITLDSMNLPGLGRYSARVMFHRGYYSGVWHGDNYGGVMSGRIVQPEEAKETESENTDDDSDER